MTWTYRVIRAADGGCRIAEVYTTGAYSDIEAPMWTADPIAPYGDNLDELRTDVHRMADALLKPVLDEAELQAAAATEG